MTKVNLNEELMNQIRLIKYDRSKTLFEQVNVFEPDEKRTIPNWVRSSSKPENMTDAEYINYITKDPTGIKEFQKDKKKAEKIRLERQKYNTKVKNYEKKLKNYCKSKLSSAKTSEEKIAKQVYETIMHSISVKGTEEQDILDALKKVTNKKIYSKLLNYFFYCNQNHLKGLGMDSQMNAAILPVLQKLEFSTASKRVSGLDNIVLSSVSSIASMATINNQIQWSFNDYWLDQYKKILSRYNPNEKYEIEDYTKEKKWYNRMARYTFPPYTREVFHNIAPLISIVLALIPGGQLGAWLLAAEFGIEVFDASIYLLADKDPYMAGFTFFMSLIPATQGIPSMLKNNVKKYGSSIIKKSVDEFAIYTDEEIEFLMDLSTASKDPKIRASLEETFFKAWAEKNIRLTLNNITPDKLSNIIIWMAKLAKVPYKVGKLGVQIGTMTFAWDWVASTQKIGLKCKRTFSWSELVSIISQPVGEKLKFLQPFTKSEQECAEEIRKLSIENLKKIFREQFNAINKNMLLGLLIKNKTISKNSTFDPRIILIQNIFKNLKLDEKIKITTLVNIKNKTFTIKNNQNYVNAKIFTTTGQLLKDFDIKNKDNYNQSFDTKNNKIFIVYLVDNTGNKKQIKVFEDKSQSLSSSLNTSIKWGIYDDFTFDMVKEYQKQKNITQTGVLDRPTIEKLKNFVLSNEIKNLTPYQNFVEFTTHPLMVDTVSGIMKDQAKLFNDLMKSPTDSLPNNFANDSIRKAFMYIKKVSNMSENEQEKFLKEVENGFKNNKYEIK